MSKLQSSWALIKASAAVLRADKELVIFPILSAIAVVTLTAALGVSMAVTGFFGSMLKGSAQMPGVLVTFLFYIVQYTIIFFANSALVGAALIRLRGGDPTVKDGFRIAMSHWNAIVGYALIAATVGMLLRGLAERAKGLGWVVVSAIGGMAWSMATYLVVPVLVVEDVNPVEAIKRSVALLKKSWGEQVVLNVSLSLIFGLVALVVILLFIPAIMAVATTDSITWIMLVIGVLALLLAFLGLINSTLQGIYVAAIYNYVADEHKGAFFSEEMIQGAFRTR